MTYRPGWSVVPQILVQKERWPGGNNGQGIPLVSPNQYVLPDQPVLRIVPSSSVISPAFPPVPETPSGREQLSVNAGNQQQGQGETFPAGLRGRVVSLTARGGVVIESHAAVVQGAFGAGNQIAGVLTMWHSSFVDETGTLTIPPGALLVFPGPVNFTMLRQASVSGIAGLIASSIALRDLEGFLQTDVLRLLHSTDVEAAQTTLPAMRLLFTEGSGNIAMPARTVNLLSRYQGCIALLSGATSARERIVPELVISLPPQEAEQSWHPQQPETTLKVGVRVRICSGDYVGVMGEIDYLFAHQQFFSSGVLARAARLRLDNGSLLVLPVTVIERANQG